MDMKQIIGSLKKGMDVVQALAPMATLAGPAVGGIANIVAGLSVVAENALRNIETGQEAASTDDVAELKEILATIQAENDRMAARIRNGD